MIKELVTSTSKNKYFKSTQIVQIFGASIMEFEKRFIKKNRKLGIEKIILTSIYKNKD